MSRSFPSSRGSSTCPWYTVGGKTSDKSLEQRINIKFSVKILQYRYASLIDGDTFLGKSR